ncbi:PorV/PorQ family protein, partial [bacterium]|nr:PorV/PorQ family protein [bacterium]
GTIRKGILSAWTLLVLGVLPLLGQGVSNQDYSGLDKYLTQGRPKSSSFVGVRAAEFLTIPVDARGIGMGDAYAAVADDISAIWWNPAGLAFLNETQVMLNVVDYTLDITYSYCAMAKPLADGRVVVGGFFGYLDVPDMEITTVSVPEGTGRMFDAYDFQMGGSLAYNFSDRFAGGLNMKYVHQDMFDNVAGNAFAIDAGAVYHTEFMDREIRFAFAVQNLGTNITMRGPNLLYEVGPEDRDDLLPSGYENYSSDAYAISSRANREVYKRTHTYRLPTAVKLALSYSLYSDEKVNWLAAGELWRNSNIPISYATGTELSYKFHQFLSGALRMGWKVQTDENTDAKDEFGYEYLGDDPTMRGFSFGGGFKRQFGGRSLEFNYAYQNKGRLTADNFFTIKVGF